MRSGDIALTLCFLRGGGKETSDVGNENRTVSLPISSFQCIQLPLLTIDALKKSSVAHSVSQSVMWGGGEALGVVERPDPEAGGGKSARRGSEVLHGPLLFLSVCPSFSCREQTAARVRVNAGKP